jgi:hypothetical protein
MEELAKYAGLARLFPLLRNARGVDRSHSLGTTAGRLFGAMENIRRSRAALIALGVSGDLRNTAGSGRGPWYIARSKALSAGLSNAFKSLDLPSLIEAR